MFVCCKLRLIVNTRARTVFLRAANWPCWANVAAYQDWSDDSNSQRSCFKNSSENSGKMLLVFEHFWLCEKSTFFVSFFSLPSSRCMSDAITSTKLEQTREIFRDSRCCLSAWVSEF